MSLKKGMKWLKWKKFIHNSIAMENVITETVIDYVNPDTQNKAELSKWEDWVWTVMFNYIGEDWEEEWSMRFSQIESRFFEWESWEIFMKSFKDEEWNVITLEDVLYNITCNFDMFEVEE